MNCFIVGSESSPIKCCDILKSYNHQVASVMSDDPLERLRFEDVTSPLLDTSAASQPPAPEPVSDNVVHSRKSA